MSKSLNVFGLSPGQNVLLVNSAEAESIDIAYQAEVLKKYVFPGGNIIVENVERLSEGDNKTSSFDVILSNLIPPKTIQHTSSLLDLYMSILKPQGRVVLQQVAVNSQESLTSLLKLNGFTNLSPPKEIAIDEAEQNDLLELFKCETLRLLQIEGKKPNYEVGSSAKINLPVPDSVATVWKIDNTVDDIFDSEEFLNDDELLEEDDLKAPKPLSSKVCGTTSVKKACKNCTCGLADKYDKEEKPSTETPKSSCGNCYLGDAFRCSSCPYLGMPAFKPGEKIQLSAVQLKADV